MNKKYQTDPEYTYDQQKTLDENDKLYFMHIPKTGGILLMSLLYDNFDFKQIFGTVKYYDLFRNFPQDVSNFEFYSGHYGYGFLNFLPKKPIIITMMRDPVEILLSFYDSHVRLGVDDEYCILKYENEPLKEILLDHDRKNILTNSQTGYFNLDLDILKTRELLKQGKIKLDSIRKKFYPNVLEDKGKDFLNIAKQRLANCSFVGITEEFKKSLSLLCYNFGWYQIKTFRRMNVAPTRTKLTDLDEETIMLVKNAVKLDTELYRFAKEMFENRYSKMVRDLKEKFYETKYDGVHHDDVMNSMLEKHYYARNESNIQFSDHIDYDFSQKIIGHGWHYRELLPNGKIRRWTGPNLVSTIFFPLVKRDYKIRLHIPLSIQPEILMNFKLEINNEVIELVKNSYVSENNIIEGIIPSKIIKDNFLTCVKIIVEKTVSPHSINQDSPDIRKLGLFFERIFIEAL